VSKMKPKSPVVMHVWSRGRKISVPVTAEKDGVASWDGKSFRLDPICMYPEDVPVLRGILGYRRVMGIDFSDESTEPLKWKYPGKETREHTPSATAFHDWVADERIRKAMGTGGMDPLMLILIVSILANVVLGIMVGASGFIGGR